jgi:hypothetical protein
MRLCVGISEPRLFRSRHGPAGKSTLPAWREPGFLDHHGIDLCYFAYTRDAAILLNAQATVIVDGLSKLRVGFDHAFNPCFTLPTDAV